MIIALSFAENKQKLLDKYKKFCATLNVCHWKKNLKKTTNIWMKSSCSCFNLFQPQIRIIEKVRIQCFWTHNNSTKIIGNDYVCFHWHNIVWNGNVVILIMNGNFDILFSRNLHILRCPKSKKVLLGESTCELGEYSDHYITKTKTGRKIKFYL